MDDFIIRKADIKDFEALQKLDEGLFYNEAQFDSLVNTDWPFESEGKSFLMRMLTSSESICFVAETNNTLIGFLTGSLLMIDTTRPIQRSQLINIYVTQKWRSKKVGEGLAKAFAAWSKEKGAKKILVMAFAANTQAIAFYKRLGFSPRHLTLETDIQ